MFWAGVALFAVLAAYANSFDNAFHFDDFHTITDNPAVRSLQNVPRFFTDASTFSVLPANRTYRPFVSASLAVDYALGHGYVPFWFHLSTFVWFVVLLGLLYLLYETVLERTDPGAEWNALLALGMAAWFGLHPAMAETVNYVIQRGDVFCTLGCVAGLVVFARWPKLRKTGLYLLPFAFALLSKPPAAVFPVLLLFHVFFFEAGDARWKRSSMAALPSLAVMAAGLWLQSAMTPKSFVPSMLSASAYRMVQPLVWLRYAGELFLPVHLNVDSDMQAGGGLNGAALLGLLFIAGLAAAIWWTARWRRLYPIAYGLIWFVAAELPTSVYPLSEVENDHRMFFAFPGLMLAVVWAAWLGVRRLPDARMRPVLVACVLLMLGGYGWGVHVRNRVWKTEESLWLDDVEKSPRNGRGLMIYGLTQMNKGEYPVALGYFERALVLTPNYPALEINLGVVNGAMGRSAEAERHFLQAIALAPEDDQARAFYGRWLLQVGRIQEAADEERKAIALNPARPMERDLLLDALMRLGDAAALRKEAAETLAAVPGDALAKNILARRVELPAAGAADLINRSLALNHAGKYEESIVAAQEALKLDSNASTAWNNIAADDAAMHRWDEAIAAARKAIALQPDFQLARNNLAWSESQRRLAAAADKP